jgi:orotidine-5'-phosphate decarboxylase
VSKESKLVDSRVIIALDYASKEEALTLVRVLEPGLCKLKIGKELFTLEGPELVRILVDMGFDVFLDLKFHDIPNTVAQACKAAASLGVWMLNVHALGGQTMLQAAREAIDSSAQQPLLIGVTILTSMSAEDLQQIGISGTAEENVERLALLSENAALDGVVCSSKEVQLLRKKVKADFKLVTPGIRPAGSNKDDQKRIMTPQDAIEAGSDYLVIGRPITKSKDPLQTLIDINRQIAGVL